MPRRVAVLTGSRSEYGLLRYILEGIRGAERLALDLIVTGSHLCPDAGMTVREIEVDGFVPAEKLPILFADDGPAAIVKSMGVEMIALAGAFARRRPDVLLVVGDRYETFAAAAAAAAMGIPLVHLCGGETTEGALDEQWRHAITKLAHLHLPAIPAYARRLEQMGEEAWRIRVVGSPGLEAIRRHAPMTREQLERELGLTAAPYLLVAYHPVTTAPEREAARVEALLGALDAAGQQVLVTGSNADAGGRAVSGRLEAWAHARPFARFRATLGSARYLSALGHAAAIVGNSSSALIEAPSFALPAVNVGARQRGRVRAANVIDVGDSAAEIAAGIAHALAPEFRAGLAGLENPYGDGLTSARVVEALVALDPGPRLFEKRFVDHGAP